VRTVGGTVDVLTPGWSSDRFDPIGYEPVNTKFVKVYEQKVMFQWVTRDTPADTPAGDYP